jgi:hypothetical protein
MGGRAGGVVRRPSADMTVASPDRNVTAESVKSGKLGIVVLCFGFESTRPAAKVVLGEMDDPGLPSLDSVDTESAVVTIVVGGGVVIEKVAVVKGPILDIGVGILILGAVVGGGGGGGGGG